MPSEFSGKPVIESIFPIFLMLAPTGKPLVAIMPRPASLAAGPAIGATASAASSASGLMRVVPPRPPAPVNNDRPDGS